LELRAARFGGPNAPQVMLVQSPLRLPIPPPPKPRLDQDLARGVWAEGAAEDVPYKEFFDVLRLRAGPLHRRFAELDGRDIGESAAKAAERRPDAAFDQMTCTRRCASGTEVAW
jgi:hypothetical protein